MSVLSQITPPHPSPGRAWSHIPVQSGKWIGKFRIVGELGRGGMGVVYEAHDSVLDRPVAIKLLPRSVSDHPETLQRFLREARSAARLNHLNVVAVYEADQIQGQYYIVMELVRGRNLQDVILRGSLDWITATRVLRDACRGMETAHRAGLVHRDIKPANLMQSDDGTVKLADFGLARTADSNGASMTGSGNLLGTPQYMSPEQCRSELADERSDIYAMGATYFALLTGRAPFPGDAPLLVMNAHLQNPIPDPCELNPEIPSACSAIVRRAMAKDPDDRYQDVRQLLADLESVLMTVVEPSHAAIRMNDGLMESASVTTPGCRYEETSESPTATDLSWGLARRSQPGTSAENARVNGRRPRSEVALQSTRSASRTRRVAETALLAGIALMLSLAGWIFFGGPVETGAMQPMAANPARIQAPGGAIDFATTAGHIDSGFHLPGMRPDEIRPNEDFQTWSMVYPGITHVGMADSGEFLVVLTNDSQTTSQPQSFGNIHIWSRNGIMLLNEMLPGPATSVAVSLDSCRVAVGTTGGHGVLLWNAKTWQREEPAKSSEGGDVDAVAVSNDGRWLAFTTTTGEYDNAWVLWDLKGKIQKRLSRTKNSGRLPTIAFAPEEELVLMTGSHDGNMRLWSGLSDEQPPRQLRTGAPVATIAFSPLRKLVAAGTGKYFALWSYRDSKREYAVVSQTGDVNCVAFSPTGQELCWAAGSSLQRLNLESGIPSSTLSDIGSRIHSIAWIPETGDLLCVCAEDRLVLFSIRQQSQVVEESSRSGSL